LNDIIIAFKRRRKAGGKVKARVLWVSALIFTLHRKVQISFTILQIASIYRAQEGNAKLD